MPDNTIELTNLFETKDKAYKALTDVYSYFPDPNGVHSSYWLCGDEWCERLDSEVADYWGYCPGSKVMRDWSTASSPILSYWDGTGQAYDLYEGIRICNIVLEGLHPDIPDLTIYEFNDWIAQIKVLKAYYHFFLLSWYGPIIIVDKNNELDDMTLYALGLKSSDEFAELMNAAMENKRQVVGLYSVIVHYLMKR